MHRTWAPIFALALLAGTAHAQVTEIYKCVDAKGRASYTNDKRETKGKRCELVTTQVNVAPAQRAGSGSARRPGDFPRESAAEANRARERQRGILEKELSTELAALGKAREALAAQEATRSGEERNYAKVEERLQPYKDTVETHEKNIEALRRELNNLYR